MNNISPNEMYNNGWGVNPMGIGMNEMGLGINSMGMGMNQMGMGINPIGMNSIGMNLDQTAQNIKEIIQPYENKIRELEEIIKQKDFEITVLKQKLKNSNANQININQMNMMDLNKMNMMNLNQMNMLMSVMNPQEKGKEISVGLKIQDNKIIYAKCFEKEKASILREKLNLNDSNEK